MISVNFRTRLTKFLDAVDGGESFDFVHVIGTICWAFLFAIVVVGIIMVIVPFVPKWVWPNLFPIVAIGFLLFCMITSVVNFIRGHFG